MMFRMYELWLLGSRLGALATVLPGSGRCWRVCMHACMHACMTENRLPVLSIVRD